MRYPPNTATGERLNAPGKGLSQGVSVCSRSRSRFRGRLTFDGYFDAAYPIGMQTSHPRCCCNFAPACG